MSTAPMIANAEPRGRRVRHRLGIVGLPGFSPVPHLLLLQQAKLGLSSDELNVFLNIFMHWHDSGRLPFVHTATIAKRMGIGHRKVQRVVANLRKKGMVEKVPGLKRSSPKEYDVRPLLLKLEPHAKEWAALKERPTENNLSLLEDEL